MNYVLNRRTSAGTIRASNQAAAIRSWAELMWVISSTRVALAVSAVVLTLSLLSWSQARSLTLDQILTRMQQAEAQSREQSVAYTVTREYQLSAVGAQHPNSDVVAQVNFIPPSAKDYSIVKSEGSERGASIVRKVLDHEAEMAEHSDRHEISRQNYDFALLGRATLDGHDCYILQLTPRRQAVELIEGKAWVDANNFIIRQIKGTTSKSPLLWIKNLNVTINYGQVNGVWLQTSTEAVADVRFAGTHVLTSHELDVQPASLNAQVRRPARPRPRKNLNHVHADTATWISR